MHWILLLIFILIEQSPFSMLKNESALAEITTVNINTLKYWQDSNGLKSTLSYGDSGDDVILLQKMLSQDSGTYPKPKITGYYNKSTKKAVMRFQEDYDLLKTGIVDVPTKDKLNKIFFSHLCPKPTVIYPELFWKKITKKDPLPKDYVPPSLEDISTQVKTIGIMCIRQDVARHLISMFVDAQRDGVYLAVTSAYRRPEIQKYLFKLWLKLNGPKARSGIAKPGFSEHQLGTAVDLTDSSINYAGASSQFATSDGGQWLMQNAHKYGFIMSYPKGKEKITGYKYEPWHWRFVGIHIATIVHNKNLIYNHLDEEFK